MSLSGIIAMPLSSPLPASIVAAPPLARRFTLDGDRALERSLERTCARVVSGVRGLIPPEMLEGILLGGGYGRGEGGVLRDAAGDWPYNDLEFYVVVSGHRLLNEMRYGRALEALGEILTHFADVEVEFKIAAMAEWRAQPVSMFSYDLFSGHRLLWGDPQLLAGCGHHLEGDRIPLAEATRLLMNRSTGLLLAHDKFHADPLAPGDADFIRRNIAKAALACGDAVLTARGLYDWSCRERHRQLERIVRLEPSPWHELLLAHHAAGLEFKLHPTNEPLSRFALWAMLVEITELSRQCWLWIEQRRLGRAFPSVRAYAQDLIDKCPGTPPARNLLLTLRADGFRPHLSPRPWRHPRQRIFHALALLLWYPNAAGNAVMRAQLRRELRTRATTLPALVRAYTALWRRVR